MLCVFFCVVVCMLLFFVCVFFVVFFFFWGGGAIRKSFHVKTLYKMIKVTKLLYLYNKSDPRELTSSAPGLYTCI